MDKRYSRRTISAGLLVSLLMAWAGPAAGASAPAAAAFHIGIMTGTGNQSLEELRGVREMIRLYGEAARGGLIRHVTCPDNFMSDIETTVDRLLALGDDPLMKVVVVSQAVPGTAEAFRLLRARRPDILLLAGQSHEDMEVISKAADLVISADFLARGYTLPHTARELGAETFVHISFPRHMLNDTISRRRAVMERACRDLGLDFDFINVPDPLGVGLAAAKRYIIDNFPAWLERYGPQTAFFTTNDALTQPLISQVLAHGGYFIEADMASPLLGYPETLGLDFPLDVLGADEWAAARRRIEEAVVKAGGGGRLGSWAYSLGFCQTAALTEFGKLVTEGRARPTDKDALLKSFEKFSPGARWNGEFLSQSASTKPVGNYFLVYQDTYIFGRGYMGAADLTIPDKYFRLPPQAASRKARGSSFRIGLVTATTTQSQEDFQGAEEMIRRYGAADQGGLIRHVTYPDDFIGRREETIDVITGLADDPLVKVVVVNEAVLGTAEAFRRIRAKRPEIILLAGGAHDPPEEMNAVSDLTVTTDFISRGYLIPHSARRLGADALVHISFPRHLSYESLGRRRAIMEEACADLGLKFAQEEAPDPTGPAGVEGARRFILEKFPEWRQKYGPNAAYFCTNDAHTAPLIRQITALGGLFIEADTPAPFLGFPEAFDLKVDYQDWPNALKKIEQAASARGAAGRLGVWTYSIGFCHTAGLVEFGRLAAAGQAQPRDTRRLLDSYGKFSPGTKWSGNYYMDPLTGKPLRNYFLIYQDTYILGRGYLKTTEVEIPDKYFMIGKGREIPETGQK